MTMEDTSFKVNFIADSPGMGKTFLLANIARKIQEKDPSVVVLYIVLQEFMQQSCISLKTDLNIANVILEYASHDIWIKPALYKILNCDSVHIALFLDGYDEVPSEKLDQTDAFLKKVGKLKNFRTFVTTRMHFKSRLERILKLASFQTLPFNEGNQIEFLTKYWTHEHCALNGAQLEFFARKCLTELHDLMTDEERIIAGVPLQCMMLAEVYAKDAKRCSRLPPEIVPNITVKVTSFFQMYKLLVLKKFSKVFPCVGSDQGTINRTDEYKACYNAHVSASFSSIFPDLQEKFESQLKGKVVNDTKLFSIGLLERSLNSEAPRFVHRTFAEYLLAQFLVENIGDLPNCIEVIMNNILGQNGISLINSRQRPLRAKFKYPVVAYFLDKHLEEYFIHGEIDDDLLAMIVAGGNVMDEDICISILASSSQGLQSCFDLSRKLLRHVCKSGSRWAELMERYIVALPHLAIENSKNLSHIKAVFNLLLSELKCDLDIFYFSPKPSNIAIQIPPQFQSIDTYRYPWICKCTPLHAAIFYGNDQIVSYLLDIYGNKVKDLKYLLHVCVRESSTKSDAVIKDNMVTIIDLLLRTFKKYNINLLDEQFEESGCSPILQDRVHIELLKFLVQNGANINAASEVHGTLLHRASNKEAFENLISWAKVTGFKLFNFCNKKGVSPLQSAIQKFGALKESVLKLFYIANADFNLVDLQGEHTFFSALRTGNIQFIEKMMKYGADFNNARDNMNNETAAHKVIKYSKVYGWDCSHTLKILELLVMNGFAYLNEENCQGLTPLHYTMQLSQVGELLNFFHENKADFNASDCNGDSVLFHAIFNTQDCLKNLIELGANINHKNSKNQSVFHITAYCGCAPAWNLLFAKFDFHTVDIDGNTPMHLLFSTKSVTNFPLLHEFLALSDFFLENKKGNVPILEWVLHGPNCIFELVSAKTLLPVTSKISSQIITSILSRRKLSKSFLHKTTKKNVRLFIEFLEYLIAKGGRILMNDGAAFKWSRLEKSLLIMLDRLIIVDKEMLQNIRQNSVGHNIVADQENLRFLNLLESVAMEQLIISLLKCGRYEQFLKLCQITIGLENQNVGTLNLNMRLENFEDDVTLEQISKETLDWLPNCSSLHVACYYGSFESVSLICEEYGDEINNLKFVIHACVRNSMYDSNLCIHQKQKILRLLVSLHPNWLEETFEFPGRTPLLQQNVHFELLKSLVSVGANINAFSTHYGTVIHTFEEKEQLLDFLNWAIQNDFNLINHRDINGGTALWVCIRKFGKLDNLIIQKFCEAGADLNTASNSGYSVLFLALEYGYDSSFIEQILDYGADANQVNRRNENAFSRALVSEHVLSDSDWVLSTLKVLISRGFNRINHASEAGFTPLYYAITSCPSLNVEILNFLYANGADFYTLDNDGNSVLFHAIRCNVSYEIIHKVVLCGANLNHCNRFGQNAAHYAAMFGSLAAMTYLVGKIDVNKADNDGKLPLHLLFSESNREYSSVLNLLLPSGCSLDKRDKQGLVPFECWIKEGQTPIYSVLESKSLLSITNQVASNSIKLLLSRHDLLQYYLRASQHNTRQSALLEFFQFLFDKGGKFLSSDGNAFAWSNLKHAQLKSLDQKLLQKKPSSRVFKVLTKNKTANLSRINISFQELIELTDVSVEELLLILLNCGEYELFLDLCKILSHV